jgi:hypothetical protein
MNIEEAIQALLGERQGTLRGRTATPRHQYYELASPFQFQRCQCTYDDRDYGWHEYIAIGSGGSGNHPLVVALNLKRGRHFLTVSCGPKGYHTYRGYPCA